MITNFFIKLKLKFFFNKFFFNKFFFNKFFFNLDSLKRNFFYNEDFFFFKKNHSTLKSNYYRNKSYSKNIVLLGLYINIIFIYEIHILYYNNTINHWYISTINYILLLLISIYLLIKFFYKKKNICL